MIEITDKDYKKFKKYALIISRDRYEAEELVQDFLLKLLEKPLSEKQSNDNFHFMMIRNLFLNKKSKEKVRNHINNHSLEFMDECYEPHLIYKSIELMENEDTEFQKKLNVIEKVVNTLQSHDKKLFYLHYIEGIPQRQISRETGIGIMPIFYRLGKIKTLIIKELNNPK